MADDEIGSFAAAVAEAEAEAKPEPTPAPPPAPPIHVPLTEFELAKLAREIAMDIYELPKILASYGLTKSQYAVIKAHPLFDAMLSAAKKEWSSALSTTERIRVESAAALEEALPYIAKRMMKPDESLAMQVQAGQLLAKLAGIDEKAQGSGEKFTITIDLGADAKFKFEQDRAPTRGVESSVAPLPALLEAKANAGPIQPVIEGAGATAPVPANPEKT